MKKTLTFTTTKDELFVVPRERVVYLRATEDILEDRQIHYFVLLSSNVKIEFVEVDKANFNKIKKDLGA